MHKSMRFGIVSELDTYPAKTPPNLRNLGGGQEKYPRRFFPRFSGRGVSNDCHLIATLHPITLRQQIPKAEEQIRSEQIVSQDP